MKKIKIVDGGVTSASGFVAGGIAAGIKHKRGALDLGIVFSESPAVAAGTFTQNRVRAACVDFNSRVVKSDNVQAICCNSGNANACTGKQGVEDVKSTAKQIAKNLGINAKSVLVASTGIIGEFMPMEKLISGIDKLSPEISKDGGVTFAEAILTTDLVKKEIALELTLSCGKAVIGGCAKGSGMIHPNMATMLGFITTDISVDKEFLSEEIKSSVDKTFNNLTVDGDTSTNDMVLVMANGASGIKLKTSDDKRIFREALFTVCDRLCAMIAADGEGATKHIEVRVKGGKNYEENRKAAKAIAGSNLVKTAMFGNDPNWGRILAAVGYSGSDFCGRNLTLSLCGTKVYGSAAPASFDKKLLSKKMKAKDIVIDVDLGKKGKSEAIAHTCDLTYDYVKINAEYHT